jgi:hypothetical protein
MYPIVDGLIILKQCFHLSKYLLLLRTLVNQAAAQHSLQHSLLNQSALNSCKSNIYIYIYIYIYTRIYTYSVSKCSRSMNVS